MSQSNVSMMNLPDEIIMVIWSKLTKIDVLYSFVGVNKRLNKLVRDAIYTHSIELVKLNSKSDDYSLIDSVLDRFCMHILPQIHELVQCLTLESMSMKRILLASNYPHLRKLTLVKVDQEFVLEHFTDESPLAHIFKNQITHFTISLNDLGRTPSLVDFSKNVFARIFSMFTSLVELDFGSPGTRRFHARLKITDLPSTTCFSSSITHLRISVDTIDDCLCLLDGRLSQLRRFVVLISDIGVSKLAVNNTILTTLKSFSLTSHATIKDYDNQVVPLLHRMVYLEELTLRLSVTNRSTFIDSIHLNNEILIYMPQLQTLTFNIVTDIRTTNETNQQTFYGGKSHQLMCYTNHYPRRKARSHIYSLPYTLNDLRDISNNFPGGLFLGVRQVSLADTHYPFEHDFFVQIARCFPLLTYLFVFNVKPQKYKRLYQSNENDQISSIVEFSHLTKLHIGSECIDYAEQFLISMNTRLPCLIELAIPYELLEIVTENFTRFATYHTCASIERLTFVQRMVHVKELYKYFPRLK